MFQSLLANDESELKMVNLSGRLPKKVQVSTPKKSTR